MRNFKPLLWSALACVSIVSQVQAAGINWTTGLTFEQIKQKAKQENKYIFMDCYTTWCTFCKKMDAEAYVNEQVGSYFNDKFISVKVQFDQKKDDSADVKVLYEDAKALGKQYMIDGYPTFIFFSPDGTPVYRSAGFQTSTQLIEMAGAALKPGAKYEDKLTKYTALMEKYKAGEHPYDEYPFMIDISKKVQDKDSADKLHKELLDYVYSLPKEQRYTKDRIAYWNQNLVASTARTYKLFLEGGDIIDKMMEQPGYAARFIDKTVQAETVTPFFEEQAKGTGVAVSGMYMSGPGLKANKVEADWKALEKLLAEKYGKEIADRNIYTSRIEWYNRHQNSEDSLKWSLLKMKKYPMDIKSEGHLINSFCWDAFMKSNDQKALKECAGWMEKVVAAYPKSDSLIDTYAQLLYKTGQLDKGLEWEMKASALAPDDKSFAEMVDFMKHKWPTYVEYGANWGDNKNVTWDGYVFNKFVVAKTEDKKPLAGVTVLNKRTNETKTTSEKGSIGINVSVGDVLVISMAGYVTQEVKVTKDPGYFDLVLKPGS